MQKSNPMPAPFSYYARPHYYSFFYQTPVLSSVTTLWLPHEFKYLLWCTQFWPCYQGFSIHVNLWYLRALQQLKAGRGRGTGWYHYYSSSQKLQQEFTHELKITIGKQTIPPVIMWQQCSISISIFFPRPMKHFNPSGHILPNCQSKITCSKKANVDNLVKFVLNSIQGLIIADDWRVDSLHVEKQWSSKTELVNNNKWIGIGFTNLHVNFDGSSFELLIPTGHNSQEVILL